MLIISWIKAADHVCGAFCATRRGVGREMQRGVGREILLKEGSLFDAGLALVSFPGFLPQDRQPLSQGAVRSCWIEIMTNQILHSRLASEPPHVMLPPRLWPFDTMEFNRLAEADHRWAQNCAGCFTLEAQAFLVAPSASMRLFKPAKARASGADLRARYPE